MQLISGQSATSETSVVAQLRAELSVATDFEHQLVLQNVNLTGRVNELLQEQEGTQHYFRDILLERNAVTKDFNSELELRERTQAVQLLEGSGHARLGGRTL